MYLILGIGYSMFMTKIQHHFKNHKSTTWIMKFYDVAVIQPYKREFINVEAQRHSPENYSLKYDSI